MIIDVDQTGEHITGRTHSGAQFIWEVDQFLMNYEPVTYPMFSIEIEGRVFNEQTDEYVAFNELDGRVELLSWTTE